MGILAYMAHIKREIGPSGEPEVTRIIIPELKINRVVPADVSRTLGSNIDKLEEMVGKITTEKIKTISDLGQNIPPPQQKAELKEFLNFGEQDKLLGVFVTAPDKGKGYLEKGLKIFSDTAMWSGTISGTFFSVVALDLASKDATNQSASQALSIISSLNSAFLGVMIYYYSQSGESFAQMGKALYESLNAKFSSTSPPEIKQGVTISAGSTASIKILMQKLCSKKSLIELAKLALLSMAAGNALVAAINTKTTLEALVKEDQAQGSNISNSVFEAAIYTTALTQSINSFIFVLNFLSKAISDFGKRKESPEKEASHDSSKEKSESKVDSTADACNSVTIDIDDATNGLNRDDNPSVEKKMTKK